MPREARTALILAALLPAVTARAEPGRITMAIQVADPATRPAIARALRLTRPALRSCHRRARGAKPGGVLVLRVEVKTPGAMPHVRVLKSGVKHHVVHHCMSSRLRRLIRRVPGTWSATITLTIPAVVTGPVVGDPRARVFHYPGCRRPCKNCTARYTTALPAVRAGYRPHRACSPPGAEIPPIPRPGGKPSCRRDKDCALLPLGPCRCPPCGYSWRAVGTAEMARGMSASYAVMGACIQRSCGHCVGGTLGSRAVCVRRRCEVRP